MATVEIGTKTYVLGELNFIAIEKAWSAIQDTMMIRDPIQAVGSALEVIGAAIQEEDGFKKEDFGIDPALPLEEHQVDALVVKFLKRALKANQIANVTVALNEVIDEAGLRPAEGELMDPGTQSPGTETSIPSLPSSSPQDAKAEAGSE